MGNALDDGNIQSFSTSLWFYFMAGTLPAAALEFMSADIFMLVYMNINKFAIY
jgi:hypothetical protein